MLSICLHLLLESESARSLFISVPASPLSRRRERSAGTSAPFQMAFSHCQMSLRPTPPTPPNHWSAPAPPLAAPAPPHQPHPTRNCLSCGHADSVPLRIKDSTRETLTGPEQVRPGEESGIIILIRDCTQQAVRRLSFGISGVMRVPSSAPHPAAAPLHPPHPSPSIRPPSSGSRASLLVFRDPVLTHLRHSTLPGSPAATVSGRGRCALPSASSPLPSSPQAACTAAPRASGQCPAPPSTDPQHWPVRSAHSPNLLSICMVVSFTNSIVVCLY